MTQRSTIGLATIVACLLLQARADDAAWGGFTSMGSTLLNSDVSCASLSSGKVICGGRSLQHTLLVDLFNGVSWSGWTSLGGAITSNPSCTSDGAGKVICAARGTRVPLDEPVSRND